MIIQRNYYLNKLIDHKHNGMIKIISGIRRCGKSFLLFNLFKQHLLDSGISKSHIITIELDNIKQEQFQDPHVCYDFVVSSIKDEEMHYLLLDEVQMMSQFESVLNGLLRIKNLDIYVTGSNSKFLSTDIITEFRGRGDEIRIHPLSFSEFYEAYGKDWSEALEEYTIYGGMPALLKFNKHEDKIKYLKNLYAETYIKDIVNRNSIQNSEELEELLAILASNIGCLTNPQTLANTFKSKHLDLSAPTIKLYLDYLLDAFLINKAVRYDIKGKKYVQTPSKYYFSDIGLRNAKIDFRQPEETHIMENIIYNELKIQEFNVDVGEVKLSERIQGVKKDKTLEVDFVVNFGSKRYYIQSAYSLPTQEKREQEERSLINIPDSFKKVIIVWGNKIPNYDENGILILGLKDFLLNPSSLDF